MDKDEWEQRARAGMANQMANQTEKQVGGNHYKQFGEHQPVDVIMKWELNFLAGNAVKYLSRYQHKGTSIQDLQKAIHYIEMEIERLEKGVLKCSG